MLPNDGLAHRRKRGQVQHADAKRHPVEPRARGLHATEQLAEEQAVKPRIFWSRNYGCWASHALLSNCWHTGYGATPELAYMAMWNEVQA